MKNGEMTMLERIRAVSATAYEAGSLKPAETKVTNIAGTGTTPPFQVRLLRKQNKPARVCDNAQDTSKKQTKKQNPFLPYDASLFVQDVSPAHVLLLNKFPVTRDHALLVTREYEAQSGLLSERDHEAMWRCLNDTHGLAFYNAGAMAGASQPHKHLQLLPAPVAQGWARAPFDDALRVPAACGLGELYAGRGLSFMYAATGMHDVAVECDVKVAAATSMQRYTMLLAALDKRLVNEVGDMTVMGRDDLDARPFAYNMVVCEDWMVVVPRRAECWLDVSVNALGFIGCLLVRSERALAQVVRQGGMAVLQGVTFADDGCVGADGVDS